MSNVIIDGDTRIYQFGFDVYPVAFRIYYGDDTTYTGVGTQSELRQLWKLAPDQNVQVVVLYENTLDAHGNNTKMLYSGVDYFMFDGERFIFDNVLYDGHVLFGLWDSNRHFALVRDRALKESL